jgi:ribosome-dependent ATPase
LGLTQSYLSDQQARGRATTELNLPVSIETRFRYNQAFKSVYSIIPGVFMLLLMLIPAMMTAVGVVREKESGSIANFRSTPITRIEFLVGKQLPYVIIALISFVTLLLMAYFLFHVPVRGSFLTLLAGVLAYVCGSTGFGLLISSFTSTQVAAIFTAAVLSITPCINFSGLLVPVSTLTGAALVSGVVYPAGYFMQISLGAFTKGLGILDLWSEILVLVGFAVGFVAAATLALRKQEA